jgi:hypothetical protein
MERNFMDGLYQVGDRQLTYASCGVRGLGIRVSYVTYIYESTVSYLFYERKALACTDKECPGEERIKLQKHKERDEDGIAESI